MKRGRRRKEEKRREETEEDNNIVKKLSPRWQYESSEVLPVSWRGWVGENLNFSPAKEKQGCSASEVLETFLSNFVSPSLGVFKGTPT